MTTLTPIPVTAAGACCAPVVREALTAAAAETLAMRLTAVAELAGLSQPTVSQHLKVLVDAGLLTREKRGVWAFYTVVPAALDALAGIFATS